MLGAVGVLMLALGALIGAPALIVVGLLLAVVHGLVSLSRRRGVRGVTYTRHLAAHSAVWGDELPMELTTWNRSPLPLAWLRVDDRVSDDLEVRERHLLGTLSTGTPVLSTGWTLGPYERVHRTVHLVASRRGQFRLGPVRLEAADLFAADPAVEERPGVERYVIAPRSVPVRRELGRTADRAHQRPARGHGADRALYAGLRPYVHGDTLRDVHWKAAARTGELRSKRFDPSREREVLIALDIQSIPGPHWQIAYDEDLVEGLCVTAASLARDVILAGGACGMSAAAYSGSTTMRMRIVPASGAAQLVRIASALGRMSSFPSGPFEGLLAALPRWLSRDATVVVLTARDATTYLPSLRRLAATGFPVQVIGLGPDARRSVTGARRVGIGAFTARLSPNWRTCEAIDLAG